MAQRQTGPTDPGDPLDLEQLERSLRERLGEIHARTTELKKPPERGSAISFGKRIGDGTSEAVGRLTEVGVADSLDAIEERLERGLEKLEEGSYGICDRCGTEIPGERLRIAPESNLCVRCAGSNRPR